MVGVIVRGRTVAAARMGRPSVVMVTAEKRTNILKFKVMYVWKSEVPLTV